MIIISQSVNKQQKIIKNLKIFMDTKLYDLEYLVLLNNLFLMQIIYIE